MLRSKSTPVVGQGNGPLCRPTQLTRQPKPPNYPVRNQVFYKFGDDNYTVGVVTMQGKRYAFLNLFFCFHCEREVIFPENTWRMSMMFV